MTLRAGAAVWVIIIALGGEAAVARADTFVDARSIGGRCSDGRSVAQASSPATPWCSLARAVEASPSGATVQVRAGTYPALTVRRRWTATVTVKAFAGERPAIEGTSIGRTEHFRLEGMRITGDSVLDEGCRHVTYAHNRFDGHGIFVWPTLAGGPLAVVGNTFRDVPDFMLRVNAQDLNLDTGLTIRGNLFDDSGLPDVGVSNDDAIQLGGQANDALIEGNEFTGIRNLGGAHADPIQLVDANRTRIVDNYIHDGDSTIMIVHSANRDTLIENNRIVRNSGYACDCGHFPGTRFIHNTMWANRGADEHPNTWGGLLIADDSLDANPPTRGLVIRDNLIQGGIDVGAGGPLSRMAMQVDYNLFDVARERVAPHDLAGAPRFNADWTLRGGSVGKGAASDGRDMGYVPAGARPRIRLLRPRRHAQFRRSLRLRARATDDGRIVKVVFGIDGRVVRTDRHAPYGFTWHGRPRLHLGRHVVRATAVDDRGRRATARRVVRRVRGHG